MIMLRTTRFLLLTTLLAALPAAALAQCSTGLTNDAVEGSAVFGLRWDGLRLSNGQSVTLDCDSRLTSASFRISSNTGTHGMGVPYFGQGDEMHVDLVDHELNVLLTGTAVIAHESGLDWVTVDFSTQSTVIPAGEYLLAAYMTVDKIGSIGTTSDLVPGNRHWYEPGENWGNASSGDVNVIAVWEEALVPAETRSFSQVKASFR